MMEELIRKINGRDWLLRTEDHVITGQRGLDNCNEFIEEIKNNKDKMLVSEEQVEYKKRGLFTDGHFTFRVKWFELVKG